jgi:hypothetical protein
MEVGGAGLVEAMFTEALFRGLQRGIDRGGVNRGGVKMVDANKGSASPRRE